MATQKPQIVEWYAGSKPRFDYARGLRKILSRLPERHFVGLGSIVLRDVASVRKTERNRRKGRTPYPELLGLYMKATRSRQAHIELFVDNILEDWPLWFFWLPVVRFPILYRPFFHELGHHVYAMRNPAGARNEEQSDDLGWALMKQYYRNSHPMIFSVMRVLVKPLAWAQRSARRKQRAERSESSNHG